MTRKPDTRKGDRHKDRKQTVDYHKKHSGNRHKDKALTKKQFLCIDGEAVTRDGASIYCLLGASDGTELYDRDGLKLRDIIQWLFAKPVSEYWTFSGTYDVNCWFLGGFTSSHIDRLCTSNRNSVYWGDYRFVHYYGKYLQVTDRKTKKTIRVWDIYSYVASSFVRYCDEWKLCETTEEREWLATMKAQRGEFVESSIEDIRRYNQLELRLLHRGILQFKQLVREVGYHPSAWYSPASLAKAALVAHDVYPHLGKESTPAVIQHLASQAYYGGRFEAAYQGMTKGPLHHYDIRSAYPAQMVTLPSLLDAVWEHTKQIDLDDPSQHALVQASWRSKRGMMYGPFPVRLKAGSLRYPRESLEPGWYWSREVSAARGIADITVHDGYILHPHNDVKPLAYLRELYDQRMRLKKAHDQKQYIIKLIINSTYGCNAQHTRMIGDQSSIPKWQQLVYAGITTAGTRAMLLDAISQSSKDIIFLATDGLVSRVTLDLPLSDNLGDWEYESLPWLFVVQSGVYFWANEQGIQQHSRGIGRGKLSILNVMRAWRHGKQLTSVERRFVGYKTARLSKKFKWGEWIDQTKTLSITAKPRRERERRIGDTLVSYPPRYAVASESDVLIKELGGGYDLISSALDDYDMEQPTVFEGTDL